MSRYLKTEDLTHNAIMDADKDLFYRAVKSVVWYPVETSMTSLGVASFVKPQGMSNLSLVSFVVPQGLSNLGMVSFIRNPVEVED